MSANISLRLLDPLLAVCRLPAGSPFPNWAQAGVLLVLARTVEEVSVVCEERFVPEGVTVERGWRALLVEGPLDFALVGILAQITAPLAEAGISVFALSTYDTDYVLVKENKLEGALAALEGAGIPVRHSPIQR